MMLGFVLDAFRSAFAPGCVLNGGAIPAPGTGACLYAESGMPIAVLLYRRGLGCLLPLRTEKRNVRHIVGGVFYRRDDLRR